MTRPTEIDGRYVHGELHYKGDVSLSFDRLKPLGPNYLHQLFWPLAAEYDKDEDRTTLYLSATPPLEVLDQLTPKGA